MAGHKAALDAVVDSAVQPFRDLQDAMAAIAERQRALHDAIEDICGCEEPSAVTASPEEPSAVPAPAPAPPLLLPPAAPKKKRYKQDTPTLFPPGDPRWLEGKEVVTFAHAAGFLGKKPDTVRKIKSLDRRGEHHVTVKSVVAHWENKSGKKR
jgi:hypothetical protein